MRILSGIVLITLAFAGSAAANQNNGLGAGIFGGILGSVIQQGQIANAQKAWSTVDPYLAQCVNQNVNSGISGLISQGIGPGDPRVLPTFQRCQQIQQQQAAAEANRQAALAEQQQQTRDAELARIAAQKRAADTQQARIASDKAAADAEQLRISAQKEEEAKNQAQKLQVTAKFKDFRNNTVDSADSMSALLNYSTLGNNSGDDDDFWAAKVKGRSCLYFVQQG